jgi:hypothetical protein
VVGLRADYRAFEALVFGGKYADACSRYLTPVALTELKALGGCARLLATYGPSTDRSTVMKGWKATVNGTRATWSTNDGNSGTAVYTGYGRWQFDISSSPAATTTPTLTVPAVTTQTTTTPTATQTAPGPTTCATSTDDPVQKLTTTNVGCRSAYSVAHGAFELVKGGQYPATSAWRFAIGTWSYTLNTFDFTGVGRSRNKVVTFDLHGQF